jgi:hypothetical protein
MTSDTKRLERFLDRVANLSLAVPEIGEGMIRQLVSEASALLDDINSKKATKDFTKGGGSK